MNRALAATLLAGSLSGNRWRSALAVACIALGVALAGAVHTLHASALDEIDRAARTLGGEADLQARGPRNGFDDAAFVAVAKAPGVAVASPVVELEAAAAAPAREATTVKVLGIDPFRAARLQPAFLAEAAREGAEGSPSYLDSDVAFLTPAAASRLGVGVNGAFALRGPKGEVSLRVGGLLPALDGGGPVVVVDIAHAQLAFDRVGVIHRIDLRLAPGADRKATEAALAAALPPGVRLERPEDAASRTAGLTRAYRVNLTALALMALFTGGFLVFSTLALAAARRRQEFALLRALGLTAGGLRAFLAMEGALLGLSGAFAGTILGLAASRAMLERFGHDLGAGFFSGSGSTWSPDAPALAVVALLGVATAAFAALAVTRAFDRLDVAQALKDRHLDLPAAPGRWSPPFVVAALALLAAFLPPAGEIPVGGYLAIVLALAAAVLAVTPATKAILSRVRAGESPLLALACAQVRSLPGHLAAMVSGIVVSVALTAAMAIMVFSFRVSLDGWLYGVLGADLFARASPQGDAVVFDEAAQARLAKTPGVARVEPIRYDRLSLPGRPHPLTVMARPVTPKLLAGFQVADPAIPPAGEAMNAWMSEAASDLLGWKPGDVVTLPLAGREARLRLAGTYRDYARTWGAILVDLEDWRRHTGDRLANDIAIVAAAGADLKALEAALSREVAAVPGAEIHDAATIHRRSLEIFDRTFAATYALEAAAVLIALAGVTSSFAALAWSRRREFGVLRHLGLTRREVLRLLALEGSAAGAVGVALGLAAGAAVSVVLVRVVNRQSFHWGMEIHWPWLALALLSAAVVALCAAGAATAGRAAVAKEAVDAVKDDA